MAELTKNGFFPEATDSDISVHTETRSEVLKTADAEIASFWTQLVALSGREFTNLIKNPTPMIINVCITGFLSLIFGLLFQGIGWIPRSSSAVVDALVGALVNINISTMMGQSQTALFIFASERPLFLREYHTNHYNIAPYFLSHLASETLRCFIAMILQACVVYFFIGFQQTFLEFLAITFTLAMTSTAVAVLLGASFEDEKAAASTFTIVIVPQFYFSGVFIAINLLPEWLRWAQYLCSLTYASRLSYAYEFGNCDPSNFCEEVLEMNGVSVDDIWWYWLALLALFVLFRLAAMAMLKYKSSY